MIRRRPIPRGAGLAALALVALLVPATAAEPSAVPPGAAGPIGPETVARTAAGSGSLSNELAGIGCAGLRWCVAVGDTATPGGTFTTLAESWDGGSWSVMPSAGPVATPGLLLGASCTSASACLAVGYALGEPTGSALAESWTGSGWSIVPVPGRTGRNDVLSSVSCTGPTTCMAVGTSTVAAGLPGQGTSQTLAESWDGSGWTLLSSPNPDPNGNDLFGVSCTTAAQCTAVGESTDASGFSSPLAESWNGSGWSVLPTPTPTDGGRFFGVSCPSAGDCVAVGSAGAERTLAASWNGSSWAIEPSPSPGAQDYLTGVSCTSRTQCMAVGSQAASYAGLAYTLAETWNGTAWSTSPSPTPPSTGAHLSGVSCTTSTACTAAGTYSALTQVVTRTLIEVWGGSLWSTPPSPNVDVLATPVVGMAATSAAGGGYWLTDTAGDVTAHGGARLYGSLSGYPLAAPVNGMAPRPDGKGYWLVGADGGVFAFGDARYFGSMGGARLNGPVVGVAATPDGGGYWLAAADGGIFAFGDAPFLGAG